MGAGDNVAVTSSSSRDDDCMRDPHWYAFLCSSLITFFTGLLLVLSWRILTWLICQKNDGAGAEKDGEKKVIFPFLDLKEQYPDLQNDLVETHFLLNSLVCFLLPGWRII